MSNSWYYTHAGQSLGPVTTERLRQLACSGLLFPDDLVWPEGRPQSEAVPAQTSIDFQTITDPIVNKPAWLDDLRVVSAAEIKPTNPAKPISPDHVLADTKADQQPANSAKTNWLDDLGIVEKEEREKDKKRRSRHVEEQAGNPNRLIKVEQVQVRPTNYADKSHKLVLHSKAMVSLVVMLIMAIVVGVPLLAWDAIQRERGISEDKENVRRQAEAVEGYVRKANLATQRGAWREALVDYEKALEAGYPDPASLHLNKVRAYLAINDEDNRQREIDALSSLHNLGEHESSVLLLRGESLLGRNDIQAEQLIRQALEKETLPPGEDAYARALLADTTPKGIDLLREALALDPYQVQARTDLELLLILLARLDEARAELQVHTLLFPDDRDANVLQSLLLASEAKPAEARKVLDGLQSKLPPDDLAAIRDLTTFLAELRNPAHRPDPLLGLPELSSHWQGVQAALRCLWPSLVNFGRDPRMLHTFDLPSLLHGAQVNSPSNSQRATRTDPHPSFAHGSGHPLFSRLPPRLRKSLEGIPEMLTIVASNLGNGQEVPNQVVESLNRLVEVHPEGTLVYVQALALWSAGRWQEANKAALRAAETPALVSIRRPALFVAAASKAISHLQIEIKTAIPLRAVEALFVLSRPAFFATALYVASKQTYLSAAVENLRETVALGSYRPLLPEIAVRVAIATREYNLARQILDDWKRETDSKTQLNILSLRAETELKAGAYGPAFEATGEYLRRKPNDSAMRELHEIAKRKLIDQARRLMSAIPERRSP